MFPTKSPLIPHIAMLFRIFHYAHVSWDKVRLLTQSRYSCKLQEVCRIIGKSLAKKNICGARDASNLVLKAYWKFHFGNAESNLQYYLGKVTKEISNQGGTDASHIGVVFIQKESLKSLFVLELGQKKTQIVNTKCLVIRMLEAEIKQILYYFPNVEVTAVLLRLKGEGSFRR